MGAELLNAAICVLFGITERVFGCLSCAALDFGTMIMCYAFGFSRRKVVLADGTQAHYMHKAGRGDLSKAPLVFLPGFSMEAQQIASLMMPWLRVDRHWFGAVPLGAPDDFSVYVIELPGHGQVAAGAQSKPIEHASYVLTVLDALGLNERRIVLGGYSYGGALVLNVAALLEQAAAGTAQKRIERIVLLAPALAFTCSFHAHMYAPTANRRELLRGTHAYEGRHECRAFYERYGSMPQRPHVASWCPLTCMLPVVWPVANGVLRLLIVGMAYARSRDYPRDHFARLMERLIQHVLEHREAAVGGCNGDQAAVLPWPDEPLSALQLNVDPKLQESLSSAFPRGTSSGGARVQSSIPTLLVVAELDTCCDPQLLSRIATDGHLGDAVTVQWVKGAGHIFVPSQLATLFSTAGPAIGAWLSRTRTEADSPVSSA